MRTLIIADKQDITQIGIETIANRSQKIEKIYCANNKKELIAQLIIHPSSLIVLDYTLFDFTDINELYIISERFSTADWIIFSDELSDNLLKNLAIIHTCFSIVLKSSPLEEIKSAIVYTCNSERYICNRVANHLLMLNKVSDKQDRLLTVTEKEILKEIALSKTTKEIAFERNLSFHTVMTHRKNIFRKLEVNNVHEAIKYAMRAGIVDISEYYI